LLTGFLKRVPKTRLYPVNVSAVVPLHLNSTKLKKKKMAMAAKEKGIRERFAPIVSRAGNGPFTDVAWLVDLFIILLF
jgi:hypothetical protein